MFRMSNTYIYLCENKDVVTLILIIHIENAFVRNILKFSFKNQMSVIAQI